MTDSSRSGAKPLYIVKSCHAKPWPKPGHGTGITHLERQRQSEVVSCQALALITHIIYNRERKERSLTTPTVAILSFPSRPSIVTVILHGSKREWEYRFLIK